jgi:ZIP family zinc transporter
MWNAFIWGSGAAASLVVGALLAMLFKIGRKTLGLIMAFGVGVLISAVAFELAEEAFAQTHEGWSIAAGLAAGALIFFGGNQIIERMGGRKHRRVGGEAGSGLAILLGTILDGIPESIVIGLAFLHGDAINLAMIVAVFLSNLPEAISATAGLLASGWKKYRVLGLWFVVVIVSGLASWAGYSFFASAGPLAFSFTLAFAAGALLTMLADSMMPEAYKDSGPLVGLVTTFGFGLAFMLSMLS